MNIHKNARLTRLGRERIVRLAADGRRPGEIAICVGVSLRTLHKWVARFARWVRDAGFTVYMPSLFGRDGAVPEVEGGTATVRRACVSAEFRAFAAGRASPVAQWLRALPRLGPRQWRGHGSGAT